ncbi:MAG: dihydrolipoamide acetyltransferase component of pyruvate dehydrogenase complex [Phycisphaerae bacterium]|nr:MAG: 2-oxo acid dehydrogenase subunit E2 [Planctomycetia bacterium]RIK66858.1 MAG: branched-chain alpha-keto acid dehydrogenase subunit E2 [Planctomycetota bacterium]GJQ26998.1 MAG: dihydrolipoamide acetyltransferase component of pyruvate dehydrogenase complex [Phycisphaerae bacterium]
MAKDFKLPDLGEGIHEAQIIKVMVKEGDTVQPDQAIMEVETDKAAVELPVPFGGTISKLNVKVGDTVKVGSVLLSVGEAGEAAGSAPAKAEASKAAPAKSVAMAAAPAMPARTSEPTAVVSEAPRRGEGPIPAAPAVRRYAREQGVDLAVVHGTGPGGRIVREDVERYLVSGGSPTSAAQPSSGSRGTSVAEPSRAAAAPMSYGGDGAAPRSMPAEPMPDFSQWGPVRREALPQIRKTISRQMVRSYLTIPHVMHADEVDVTDLEDFRKRQGEALASTGAKLTLTAFVVKAVAGALRQFPTFNASYDEAASEMVFKDYVHIGVAVDSPKGLMVPVVRDADRKGLVSISKEMKELADKAREFKLDVAAMRGGTFTVTNVGALGGTMATPIINYPEVAILGMGKLEWKPVVRDMQIVPRKILPLFLSFDHRVIDGADGARFIRAVIGYLENPLNLLLV